MTTKEDIIKAAEKCPNSSENFIQVATANYDNCSDEKERKKLLGSLKQTEARQKAANSASNKAAKAADNKSGSGYDQ